METFNYHPRQLPRDPNPFLDVFLAENYDHYDIVNEFSDLKVKETEATLEAEYAIKDNMFINAGFTFLHYGDGEEYLDKNSGQAYIGTIAMTWKF